MTTEEARVAITETLGRIGTAETLLRDAVSTISGGDDREPTAAPDLPGIAVAERESGTADDLPPTSTDFVTRGVLGRGGMGVVRLALQRSLEREVAVKTSGKPDRAARMLIREARITGGLEHPNVVPVHALGVDREGVPVLVMKRVEGVAWRTLIHDETHEGWRPLLAGHGDRIRAHVEILAQVTRALVFAHDRGVIHRDVKPQNVMIGRFGEVYLLDWGVALRLDEREDEPNGIVGTPGYLAPELARGNPRITGPHTDVYLLGATLYEVLAKKPPHDAPNALSALVAALVGEPPPLPPDAPRELIQLVQKAMARDPADRFESAEAFREGLARYLASREAERVHEDGRRALARAEALIASEGPTAPDAFRALIEARFALSTAHRARADAESRAELDRCLTHLIERELVLRSPVGARTLLHEMSAPPASFDERLVALDRSLAEERAAAEHRERARREADSSLSLQAMVGIVSTIVALCVLVVGAIVRSRVPIDGSVALAIWLIPFGAFSVLAVLARKQINANATTRKLAGFLAIALLTPFACTVLGVVCGLPATERSAFSWVASAGIALLGELLILPSVWPCVVTYLIGAVTILATGEVLAVQACVILATAAIFVRSLLLHARASKVGVDDGKVT